MEYNLVAEKIRSAKENKELYYLMRKDVPVLIFSMVKSGDTVTGLKVEDVFDNERLPVQADFVPSVSYLRPRSIR